MSLLFEPEIKIPHSDFRLFQSCNNAPRNWSHKQMFYQLKNELLDKFGDQAGYDKQIVEQQCWSCNGSGWYSKDSRCRSCGGDGIYSIRTYMLKRYVLNGKLFHKPLDRILDVPVIETIKGLVVHPVPEFNPNFAYACLIQKYKPNMWPDYLRAFRKTFNRSEKKKWGEIACKSQSITEALAYWYDVKSDDDLPF